MTATMPPGVDVRDCRLYRFWVEHPVTGEEVVGYIGETVRQPFERLMEHVKDQPWIDTVIRWERDPVVYAGKQHVLEAEAAAIRAEHPLYNVRGNEQNDDRIIPPVAIRQRRARDAQRGRARWVHPDDRNRSDQSTPVAPVRRVSVPRTWTAGQVRALVWSGVWVLTAAGIWAGLDHFGLFATWTTRALCGLITAPVLIGWVQAGCPVTKRQWRRLRRRTWSKLTRSRTRRSRRR